MEQQNNSDQLTNKILENLKIEIPEKLTILTVNQLQTYMKEIDSEPEQVLTTVEDFEKFWTQPKTRGAVLRELLVKCLTSSNISFDPDELKKLKKSDLLMVFDKVYQMEPRQVKKTVGNPVANIPVSPVVPVISSKNIREFEREHIQQICENRKLVEKHGFQVSSNMVMVEKLPVTLQDNFFLKIPDTVSVYNGCAALAEGQDENVKVVAVGRLEDYQGCVHLLFSADKIDYQAFEEKHRFIIILFPQNQNEFFEGPRIKDHFKQYPDDAEVYKVECEIAYRKLEDTDKTLCIDFGTSNTTAGSYGLKNQDGAFEKIELVDFLDVTSYPAAVQPMLPTIVYVKSCTEGKVEYSFGYEAKKKIIEQDYNTTASVYHEIKRWINTLDQEEKVVDEDGNSKIIHRYDIVKAYLQHVINLSEQYFKVHFSRLHFSAPVKVKGSFINKLNEIFKDDYQILPENECLDEGVSIIYHYIAGKTKAKIESSTSKEKILIMDCGGGTTDLASCSYSWETLPIGKKLKIETCFENGNSNFGGNNITFRILQMLKIKLAGRLQGKGNIPIQQLLVDEPTMLQEIDENFSNKGQLEIDIYEKFEQAYKEAESLVPTRFAEGKFIDEKRWMKRNYYYLWQMAEAIKIEFYKEDLVSVDFNNAEDKKLCVNDSGKYYLFVRKDEKLDKYENPLQDIEITINEIRRVIYPDIYTLLNQLLGNFEDEDLLEYYYKLSGQSCKITIFHDLLKEFIPGKRIRRNADESVENAKSSVLKLACIEGSIEYIKDKEYGDIATDIDTTSPHMIYQVYLEKDNQETIILAEDKLQFVLYNDAARRAKFIIRNKDDNREHYFIYNFSMNDVVKATTLLEIQKAVLKKTYFSEEFVSEYLKRDLRNVKLNEINSGSNVVCLFALPSKDGYGINVYQVAIKAKADSEKGNNEYFLQNNGTFVSFEDETLETFFDGKR